MDQDLRALERAWRESGGLQEEADFLAARVRAGTIAKADVGLAARLGDVAARRALALPLPSEPELSRPLGELGPWPGGVAVSAVLELVVRVLEGAEPSLARAAAPTLCAALRCLKEGSVQSATDARLAVEELWGGPKREGRAQFVRHFAGFAGSAAADLVEGTARARDWGEWVGSAAARAGPIEGDERVRQALVAGACRHLLQRRANHWLEALDEALDGAVVPARPPLESTLGALQSALRWVHEHLSAFRELRDAGDPLAEVELRHLVGQVRDARTEAARLSEILQLWRSASERDPGESAESSEA